MPNPRILQSSGSKPAELWSFAGSDGGVLRLKAGEALRLRLANETSKPLSLHWHGVRGPNDMDGVGGLTQAPVAPGDSFDYRFTPPDAGTFLVRPCVLGASAEPTERGLTALLVVDEKDPPAVDHDLVLKIDDWKLEEDGALAPFETSEPFSAGRLGNALSVNAKPTPDVITARPGSRVRVRLANACNARAMRLLFDQLKPYVVAVDGQPTDTFEPLKASLPFPPGSRYDLLMDLPNEAGAKGAIVAQIGSGMPLVAFATAGEPMPTRAAIAPLAANKKLPAEIKLQNAARKDVVLEGGGAKQWTINGARGDVKAKPLLSVKRGAPVVITLVNKTPLVQPFHLHGHVFRLLHPLDDGWEPYFLDTLQIPESRTVRIAFVADNPGKWLLTSTVMERFDTGLWTWFEVT